MKTHPELMESKPKQVGILAFSGVKSSDVIGPLEVLAAAGAGDGKRYYEVKIIGVRERSCVTESNIVLNAHRLLSKTAGLDTVIIPGGKGIWVPDIRHRIANWCSEHASLIRRTVMIGTGIYPIAESGLLDGRKLTTHWRFAQEVAARFQRIKIDPSSSFLKDGPFYSCGGGRSAIELMLALMEEDYGAAVSLPVARELVMRVRPFNDVETTNDMLDLDFQYGPTDRLVDLPAWISSHLNENLSVEALSVRTCICPRHFGRIFKRIFKTTPARYVERKRLDEARRRLKFTRNTVEHIAHSVGFGHVDSFRRAFERYYRVSPLRYRKQSQSQNRKRDNSQLIAA